MDQLIICCNGDCFGCIYGDCINNNTSPINDIELSRRKDGQRYKTPLPKQPKKKLCSKIKEDEMLLST